jgi:hypothetical protein
MKYFNNRFYYKYETINNYIIKIKNEFPSQNESKFVLGSFNSTKEAREYVKNSDELYTYIIPESQFYEKDDFIFSNNLLDVYKHLYRRILSRLIIRKQLSTESVIVSLVYFYCIYLLKKDNYLIKHSDYQKLTDSNDPSKIKLFKIFSNVQSKESIVIYFMELNNLIEEMKNAQSISEIDNIFEKSVTMMQNYR